MITTETAEIFTKQTFTVQVLFEDKFYEPRWHYAERSVYCTARFYATGHCGNPGYKIRANFPTTNRSTERYKLCSSHGLRVAIFPAAPRSAERVVLAQSDDLTIDRIQDIMCKYQEAKRKGSRLFNHTTTMAAQLSTIWNAPSDTAIIKVKFEPLDGAMCVTKVTICLSKDAGDEWMEWYNRFTGRV